MKHTLACIGFVLFSIILLSTTVQQCTRRQIVTKQLNQCSLDYAELLKAKTKTDTIYKPGKTVYITKTEFKTITDTLFVQDGKVYSLFIDTIRKPDLNLRAEIIAADLKQIAYTYTVTERIIYNNTIIHDTIMNTAARRPAVYLVADGAIQGISAGAMYHGRGRWGMIARYNRIGTEHNDQFLSVGVVFRVY